MQQVRVDMEIGDGPKRIRVGYSEAACYLRVAGMALFATLTGSGMVQLYDESINPISFPITSGEAGLYRDAAGTYYGYRMED